MIFRNYKRKNPYKEVVDKFSDENRLVSFGVVKSFISGKYKWLSSFLFKHRNNLSTNKHKAYIGWFSEQENLLTEYGNVTDVSTIPYFDQDRPKIPRFSVELSSNQYKKIGQEYSEFDSIKRINESGTVEIPFNEIGDKDHVDIYHRFGDAPAFVVAGYKIPGRYIRDNRQDYVGLKMGNIEVYLNDSKEDVLSNRDLINYIDTLPSELEISPQWSGEGELVNKNAETELYASDAVVAKYLQCYVNPTTDPANPATDGTLYILSVVDANRNFAGLPDDVASTIYIDDPIFPGFTTCARYAPLTYFPYEIVVYQTDGGLSTLTPGDTISIHYNDNGL